MAGQNGGFGSEFADMAVDVTASAPAHRGDLLPIRSCCELHDEDAAVIFDFGAAYPVGGMRIFGENDSQAETCPLKVEYALDGKHWAVAEWVPECADLESGMDRRHSVWTVRGGSLHARYMKVTCEAPFAATVSEVQFLAASGFGVEPCEEWTNLFHRSCGWSGADGIYSIPLHACERNGTANNARTLFLFGDTFIGEVDKTSDRRISPVIINNTAAVLDGGKPRPEAVQFVWRRDDEGNPASLFVPATPKASQIEGAYYWLQDGIVVGNMFYCFPMIIGPNPDGPEGFQFAVHGIARVSAPVDEDGLRYDENIQADTDLYYEAANGRTTYFGAAFMALTESAGTANPDGHIYIYGLQNGASGPAMVVARVPEARFADFAAWRFWNGAEWTAEKEQVVPIADEISCEFSVTPMSDQWEGAAYAVVFQEAGAGLGNRLSMYVGASPVGPFADPIRLYACAEPDEGKGIYVYNAKAHPHLSRPGELLASYNVNTTSMDMHMQHAGIYRPRFVNIRQIR
ncbi:DUF4185 domain-containing protein [Paenibacillus cisolokensis]|uniref:DUF4185 domain-containing protein n=1 Tax=Paenibacillus cisolokensis TaxID=1658519 RepID=UPI001BCFA6ED|nr:DUF4185 domain-containing protein [Paenibacillus cisolokensis]